MIRTAIIGVWACAATVAGGFAGAYWSAGSEATDKVAVAPLTKLTALKSKPVSVPVVADGKVAGYVHALITLMAQAEPLKHQPVKPDVFVFEAAFNHIYVDRKLDFGKLDRASMESLSRHIKDAVNGRYGFELIQNVVIEEFGFTPMSLVRGAAPVANEMENSRRKGRKSPPSARTNTEAGADQKSN